MKNSIKVTSLFLTLMIVIIAGCNQKANQQEDNPLGQVTPGPAGSNFSYIVMLVDTENIEKDSEESYCAFANQPTNISDRDFETEVNKGDSVVWLAYSYSNPGRDSVIITKINGPDLNQILETNDITGKNGRAKGRVKLNAEKNAKKKYKIQLRK